MTCDRGEQLNTAFRLSKKFNQSCIRRFILGMMVGSLVCLSAACETRPSRASVYLDKNKPKEPVKEINTSEDLNPKTPTTGGAPEAVEPLKLSYSIDALSGSADCPALTTIDKNEDEFTVAIVGAEDGTDNVRQATLNSFCNVKGTAIVPAGYIVEVDAGNRIGNSDFQLGKNSTALFTMSIESSLDGKTYSAPYSAQKFGPMDLDFEDFVFQKVSENKFNPLLEKETLITCDDAKEANREMKFSVSFGYTFGESGLSSDVPSEADLSASFFLNKLPSVALRLKKCKAPAPVSEESVAKMVFEVVENKTKEFCPAFKSSTKTETSLSVVINPIEMKLEIGETVLIKSCTVSGIITVPKKHIIRYTVSDPIIFKAATDDKTIFRASMNPIEQSEDDIFFLPGQNIKNISNLQGEQKLAYPPPLARELAEECAGSLEGNSTKAFDIKFDATMIHTGENPTDKLQTVTIRQFPAIHFEVVKCP